MRKIPVKSLAELEANLRRDVNDRADGIARAAAIGVVEDIREISFNKVSPEFIVSRPEKEAVRATIFVPATNPEVAMMAKTEEVMGTRPFATVLNRLQSKEELKKILKGQGIS